MINGLGYKLANVPTVTGLSSVVADSIISGTTNTGTLILNGVDVSTTLAQVPINTNNITNLQQVTTGISYNTTGDLTTIDNNLTVSATKYINCNRVPTTGDNVANKTYVDTAIANLVNSAPATLDTLNELATALGNDANFSTTVTNSLAGKASLSATQTITGATTMSNALNVIWGDGSHLTGVISSTASSIALTSDNTSGDWFIPFSKTSSTTSNTLYIDNTTTPLTYNASAGYLSSYAYTIGSKTQTAGTNSSLINQPATGTLYVNNATTGRHRFYVNNSSNVQVNPFNFNSTSSDTNYLLSFGATIANDRQINNTFYNLYDNDNTISGGVYRGRIYSDPSFCYMELNTGHAFMITVASANVFTMNGTSATFRKPVIAQGVSLQINDNISLTTSFVQTTATNSLDLTQNYNGGKYYFYSKTVTGITKSCSISNGLFTAETINLVDPTSGLPQLQTSYTSPNYTVLNTANSGNIYFQTNDASAVQTTPFTINSTNCTFLQPPLCSVAPTTGNMLTNKTYVDGAFVTISTTQTVSGQKSFTNASNTYNGSGSSLTGVVLLTGTQTIAGDKTFSGNIISSSGSYTTSIDQNDKFFNITNNVLNNTITTMTGLIPSVNLSCVVRTDAVGTVGGYASISGPNITGSGGYSPYSNNFFVVGTTAQTPGITVTALNQIQSDATLSIGTYMTTFIGTRYSLGTYVTADLGLGVYSITPNALVASATKATTGTAFTALNRPFTAGGAVNGAISLDYNTTTNIQCKNTSSVVLNAISVQPRLTTSEVTIYGDCNLQGSLQYNYGGTITATTTLTWPLSQLYLLTTTGAITVTLPTASASLTGTVLTFKRFGTSVGATTINQTGGGANMVSYNSLVGVASISMGVATYQCTFMCAGVYWLLISLQV